MAALGGGEAEGEGWQWVRLGLGVESADYIACECI